MYQSWASDGGCWLESQGSDQNNTPPSPSSDDVAEFSATKIPPETGSKEENLSNNNSLCTHGGKSEHMQYGISDQVPACDHVCDPEFSATSDQCVSSNEDLESVRESGQLNTCGKFRNHSARSPDFPPGGDLSATHPGASRPLPSIHP